MEIIMKTLSLIILFLNIWCCLGEDRKIWAYPNPGCTVECDNLQILQVNTVDGQDQILYLISSFGSPTVYMGHFNSTNIIHPNISWECLRKSGSQCISFEEEILFSSSFIFNRIIEYDDDADTRDVRSFSHKPNKTACTYLGDVEWFGIDAKNYTSPSWQFLINATNDKSGLVTRNGSRFELNFNVYSSQSRTPTLPSILHSDKSGLFEMIMSNFDLHFDHSRFAVEIIAVSDSNPGETIMTSSLSVDDEYSPGVFEVVTWNMNRDATESNPGTYIHYKPVSYSKPERNYESILSASFSEPRSFNYEDLNLTYRGGLTYAIYGTWHNLRFKNVQSINLTIGQNGDKFYKAYNYTTFTAVYGFGTPLFDVMSTDVIVAISAGVGIPVLLIVTAVTIVIIRTIRRKGKAQHELLIN